MTVTQAANQARIDALVDRILNTRNERVTDRDHAFRRCVHRRWITRVGADGPEADFHWTLAGMRQGWKFTARGHEVADQALRGAA